jgi:AcrR family transcriptional regulator
MSNKKVETLERVVRVAREMFLNRPYEEVSIAEIAAIAKCSSATIYEVFKSKSALFEEARLKELAPGWSLESRRECHGLDGLISYFLGRAAYLGSRETHTLIRSASHNHDAVQRNMPQSILERSQLGDVIAKVEHCMDAGILKRGDPQAVSYVLYAACGYEPVMYGLLFSDGNALRPTTIVRTVLSTLLTAKGRKQLDVLLPAEQPPSTNEVSLSGFLQSAAESSKSSPSVG